MQQLNCSIIDKKPIVVTKQSERKYKSTFLDENKHNKLFADDDVNDYVNAKIQDALTKLDKQGG